MNALNKKYKLFIVIALAVLVIGMTFFGIFGFNQAIDFKNSYEVKVSIDNSVGNAKSVLKSSTDKFFEDKGIDTSEYAFQEMYDGKTLVYKLNQKANITEEEITIYVQDKIDTLVKDANGNLIGADTIEVTAKYSSVIGNDYFEIGWLLLAIGVGAIVIFVYALIMEKLSGATATIFSSILAGLLFVALMGITRLPAYPFVGFGIALSIFLSGALAISTLSRCKEELKNTANAKLSTWQIADKVMAKELRKYLFIAVAIAVSAVALFAFITPYLMIVAGQLVLAGICALCSSYFGAPLIWASIKGRKKKNA